MLCEQPVVLSDRMMSQAAIELIREGRSRFQTVDCFDFVPSNYELAWRALDAVKRGRFCEWGSGLGIVTGLAEILGFQAHGIELDASLAEASRRLLSDVGLSSNVETADHLTSPYQADLYYVYCWPSKILATESHFHATAPPGARLLICYGQSDFRCMIRDSDVTHQETS